MSISGFASRDSLIMVEQIQAVHRTAFGSSLTNVVAAIFMGVALWNKASEALLLFCFGLICVAHAYRYYTARVFRRVNPGVADILPWRKRTALVIGMAGMVWGFSGFV